MNRLHGVICSSRWWGRTVERELLPWGLSRLDLGEDVLEIGPGFGATTKVLAKRAGRLTVLELDPGYCERLRRELPERVRVVQGDATAMPFEDGRFSAVVCFTMLHHLPSPAAQDLLLGEAARVLRPGECSPAPTASARAASSACFTSATRSCRSRPTACRRACRRPGWPSRRSSRARAPSASARASRE
jgi:ubiquinone/menaquinone biosynthesis C-methylase UbiE